MQLIAEFLEIDAWVVGLCFLVTLCAIWRFGVMVGNRERARTKNVERGRFDDACLATLGLLLAFSFSLAAGKLSSRKANIVREASAIGDFAGVVTILPEPHRSQLLGEVRRYVDLRLEFAQIVLGDGRENVNLVATRAMHASFSSRVASIVETHVAPTLHVALASTLNGLTGAHDERLAALRDPMSPAVFLLLTLVSCLCAFNAGRSQVLGGASSQNLSTLLFLFLVSLVVYTIVDLEQPRRGLVRLHQTAMLDLRDALRN